MAGLKEGLAVEEFKPFVCVEDAEEYLRANGVNVEKVLREAEEWIVEVARGLLKAEDRGQMTVES